MARQLTNTPIQTRQIDGRLLSVVFTLNGRYVLSIWQSSAHH